MIGNKLDLCMWTKNGEATLGQVLRRINEVVPMECVNKRFIVDDHSVDRTRSIARHYGWEIIFNSGGGISDGANTALGHVETEFFCSFEQDVLLAKDWWKKIQKHIGELGVGAVSGMRFYPKYNCVGVLERYTALKQIVWKQFTLGKTLDNTVWNTAAVRGVGGFPEMTYAGHDTILAYSLEKAGYRWVVDGLIISVYLRGSFYDACCHQFFYSRSFSEVWKILNVKFGLVEVATLKVISFRFIKSPFTGILIALKMRDPRLLFAYPLFMLYYLCGYIQGRSLGMRSKK